MGWSLKRLFQGSQKDTATVPDFESTVLSGVLVRRREKDAADALILDEKGNHLLAALGDAGIAANASYVRGKRPAYAGETPIMAHRLINFNDKAGYTHSVCVYAAADKNGNDVFHDRSYKRDISFDVQPLGAQALLENPQLALDGLGRIGLREDLREDVTADVAAQMLLSIGAEKPEALPCMLRVTITDPVLNTRVGADIVIPSDAAVYLRGAENPKTFVADHRAPNDRIVLSVEPADPIRGDETLVQVGPVDGLDYTQAGALSLDHAANRIRIAIPCAAFTGDDPGAIQDFGLVDAADFGTSPFSGEYRAAGWRRLADVLGDVRANAPAPASPAPKL